MFSDKGCQWCGHDGQKVFVHGHYQCSNCGKVTDDCCSGETSQSLWKNCLWCNDLVDPEKCFATFSIKDDTIECEICGRNVKT